MKNTVGMAALVKELRGTNSPGRFLLYFFIGLLVSAVLLFVFAFSLGVTVVIVEEALRGGYFYIALAAAAAVQIFIILRTGSEAWARTAVFLALEALILYFTFAGGGAYGAGEVLLAALLTCATPLVFSFVLEMVTGALCNRFGRGNGSGRIFFFLSLAWAGFAALLLSVLDLLSASALAGFVNLMNNRMLAEGNTLFNFLLYLHGQSVPLLLISLLLVVLSALGLKRMKLE